MNPLGGVIATRFSLKIPLIVAPMGGGLTTPELVIASCEAGALGSLAAPYMKPQDIEIAVAKIRSQTSKPFTINLFAPAPKVTLQAEQVQRAIETTRKYRQELGLPDPVVTPPFGEDFDEQMAVIIKLKPAVFSFALGYIPEKYLQACKAQGIYVIGSATTLEEALTLQQQGVDAITLQGVEAGGHRSTTNPSMEDPGIGIFELLKQCRPQISLPLIAAGGLMDGADIAKALQAGADAAQLGTAFLLCSEAGTSKPYRRELQSAHDDSTQLTRVFSGRIARGIKNRFIEEMETQTNAILSFPVQNSFTRDLRKASADQDKPDFLSLWAGTGVPRIRELPAQELIATMVRELNDSI